MEARTCSLCPEPISGKYTRYCDACRAKVRRKPLKYAWTSEKDQLLRDRYDGKIKYRAHSIALHLGFPDWVVKRRACHLGLSRPFGRKEWTLEETEFLRQHVGRRTVQWIAKKLKRSLSSVVLKTKRMKISRAFRDGYTLRRLEACFGCNHRIIQGWIQDGKLRAQRRLNSGAPRDAWYTTDQDVLRFVLKFPTDFRLDKVDQPWFMCLVLGAFRKPMPVPAAPAACLEKAPPGTDCALCGREIEGLATPERRPSGPDGQMETWWYCQKCKAA